MHLSLCQYVPRDDQQNVVTRGRTFARCTSAHLAPLPVMPAHPVGAVAAVRDAVALGELVPHAVGVAALRAHQCEEVQRAKVHLQVLLQAVRL